MSKTGKRRQKQIDESNQAIMVLVLMGGTFLFYQVYQPFFSTEPTQNQLLKGGGAAFATTVALVLLIALIIGRFRKSQPVAFDFDETNTNNATLARSFEHEVATLISKTTGKKAIVTGGAGDGGVDIKVFNEVGALVGVVQCKYTNSERPIPPSHIRDLNSVKNFHSVGTAYLVTTGRFSNDSHELARTLGIKLLDGDDIQRLRKQIVSV